MGETVELSCSANEKSSQVNSLRVHFRQTRRSDYTTLNDRRILKKAELTLSTGPKLDCSVWTLRHLQCRNLAAALVLSTSGLRHAGFHTASWTRITVEIRKLNSSNAGRCNVFNNIRRILQNVQSSLRVSQRCYWELRYSEMWRHADWWVVPDVSKKHGAFIFRGQAVQENGDTTFQSLGNHSPKDTASRHLNPQNFPS
jgi:hypothetical protein